MRKAAGWCLVWLILSAIVLQAAAEERSSRATLDGKPLPALAVALYEGRPHLALSSLVHLRANVVFDRATGTAVMGFGRHTLTLVAGSRDGIFDGRPIQGPRAPVVEAGEFWLPVEWLAHFGLKYSWDEKTGTLALAWPRPYLLRAYLDKTGVGPRLILEATSAIQPTVFKLVGPDRLVVDLEGCYLYDGLGLDDRENEYFYRLRAAQNRPGVLRLVADLRGPVGYRLDLSEAPAGRLAIELNTLVYGAEIVRDEGGSRLVIRTNHRPDWSVKTATGPDRVVLELGRADLVGPAAVLPGDGDWLRGVECRRVAPDRIQVVALLARPVEPSVELARDDETAIVVRPMAAVGRLAWREGGDGLTIAGSEALEVSHRLERYPDRLVFTISHATAAPEEGERPRGAVKRYRVRAVQPGTVEISLDLRYDSPFRLEFSPDRRRLEVVFGSPPLAGKIIVIDPGHGGVETGALGRTLGLREKEINLDVALRLKTLLEEAGAVVHLTRVDDTYVPLFSRAFFANRLPAEIFISVHTNSHDDPNVNGVEVFHYPGREEARRLAGLMLEEMVEAVGLQARGVKANDFAVLRDSQVLSVLIELAFLSNPKEEAALATEDFRARAASAIARAVVRFVRGEGPRSEGLPDLSMR